MTLPNGAAGVDHRDWGITVDGSIPGQKDRSQAVVKAQLRDDLLANNTWGADITHAGAALWNLADLALKAAKRALESLLLWIQGGLQNAAAGIGEGIEWMLGLIGFGQNHAANTLLGTGQIGAVNPELMLNPHFDGVAAMEEAGGWSWDSGIDHTGVAGSGSARVIANGTFRSMLSNVVDVWPTNEIAASVWIKWANRTGAGTASLILNIYDSDNNLIDAPVLASIPAGASHDWVQLSGSYIVPKLVGAKEPAHACIGFLVDETVTGGVFWWDDASFKKINPITHEVVGGMKDVFDTIGGKVDAGVWDFIHGLQSFDTIKTGTIIDDFIPSIGNMLESGVRGLMLLPARTDPFTKDEFFKAATTQAESTLGAGKSIATILQFLNAGVSDEFERNETSLGSNWSEKWGTGNGWLRTEGHNAVLAYSWPGGDSEWSTRYVGTLANSTGYYQQNSIVLASPPELAPVGGWCGHNDVLGRVSGTTHYIRFRFGGDGSWSLDKFVSGTGYRMAYGLAGSIAVPGPGSLITLYCGEKSSSTLRKFKVMVNSRTIVNHTENLSDGTPNSACSDSYKGRGMGFRAEGLPGLGWISPGMVNYFSASDQP